MKQILYTLIFLFFGAQAWGQAGRLHRLDPGPVEFWNIATSYDSLDQVSYAGDIYKLVKLTSLGEQPNLFPLNWIKVTTENPASERSISITDFNLSSDSIQILLDVNTVNINATITDTVLQNYTINIPSSLQEGKELIITPSISVDTNTYFIQSTTPIKINNRYVDKYGLRDNESVILRKNNGELALTINESRFVKKYFSDFPEADFEGDFIQFNTRRYRTLKSLPSFLTEDGVFVRQINDIAATGENLFKGSEDVHHGSISTNEFSYTGGNTVNSPISDVTDKVTAPDGDKTADLIISTGSGFKVISKYVDFTNKSIQLDSGDVVTLSFWIRLLDGSNNNDIFLSGIRLLERQNSPVVSNNLSSVTYDYYPDTLEKDWERVQFSWEVEQDMSGATFQPGISMTYNADGVDTMSIWGVQLERTNTASEYKPTGEGIEDWFVANAAIYSLLDMKDGVLDITGAYRPSLVTDGQFIQYAIDYCSDLPDCNIVKIPTNLVSTQTILLPSYMWLIGDGRNKTTLYFDLQDSTKSGIIFQKDVGVYSRDIVLQGMTMVSLSKMSAIVDEGPALYTKVTDVFLDGNDFAKYGFLIGTVGETGAVATHHEYSGATENEYGMYFLNAGSLHEISKSTFGRNKFGLGGETGGLLHIDNTQIENNDSLQVWWTGGSELDLNGIYIENGTLAFENMYTVRLSRGRYSGGEIFFSNVEHSVVEKNRIFNKQIIKKDSLSGLTIRNNWYESERDIITQKHMYVNDPEFAMYFNSSKGTDRNVFNRIKANEFDLTNGLLENTIISNITILNNNELRGISENLIQYSDSLSVEGATASYEIQNNVVANPVNGAMDADLFIGLTDLSGSLGLGTRNMLFTPAIGDTLTVSFWAKAISEFPNTEFLFSVSGGNPKQTSGKIYHSNWVRHERTFITTATNIQFLLDVQQVAIGDTIAVYGFQVNRGINALSYVNTGATGVYNTDVTTVISDSDNTWNITGSLEISDTLQTQLLKDSDGDTGTNGQQLASTGSGTNWVDNTDSNISVTHTPVNYTSSSTSLNDNIAGIDTELGVILSAIPDNISDLTISADVDINSNKLINVTPGTASSDAATFGQVDTVSTDIRYKGFTAISSDPSATLNPRPKEVYYFDTTSAGWTQVFSATNLQTGDSFRCYFISVDVNALTIDAASGGFIRPTANGDTAADATEDITTEGYIELVWNGTNFVVFE